MRALAREKDLSWRDVEIFQTDERVASPGSPQRNLTHLRAALLSHVPLPPQHVHPMPVDAVDLEAEAGVYRKLLEQIAGAPAVLDLVHLGLGSDGHTASLFPGSPLLGIVDTDVALSGLYQGFRRMTLTYPILDRAAAIVWLVTGDTKAEVLRRLCEGDTGIPAGRVNRNRATIVADRAAARLIPKHFFADDRPDSEAPQSPRVPDDRTS